VRGAKTKKTRHSEPSRKGGCQGECHGIFEEGTTIERAKRGVTGPAFDADQRDMKRLEKKEIRMVGMLAKQSRLSH